MPPFSEIDAGTGVSVTDGAASSSRIVRSASGGFATDPPAAVPDTVTVLSGESAALSWAVIVTPPVLVVSPTAMVSVLAGLSVKSPTAAPAPRAAETDTITAAVTAVLRPALTDATPPSSAIDEDDRINDTVGAPSSSRIVSLASDGFATPPPAAVPDTVTVLSAEFTALSLAVIVTTPVLVVSPAAMVSVLAGLSVKSPTAAPAPGAAETDTITAALAGPLSVAVTAAAPPFSIIDAGVITRAAVGAASSSPIVSVTPGGFATPLPPAAAPDTVTRLSGATTGLSAAVTVTTPVLVVAPAAMVSVLSGLSVKSSAPGAAEILIVTASLDGPLKPAVTDVTPPFSAINDEDRASETVGSGSSSTKVRTTAAGRATTEFCSRPVIRTCLSGESTASSRAVITIASELAVCPAAMFRSPRLPE